MKALIDPTTSIQNGVRVAQTSEKSFDICTPFYWVVCPENIIADEFFYDEETGQFNPVPVQTETELAVDQPDV